MATFPTPGAGSMPSGEALALFDSLEPVDTTFMLGSWRGAGFPTGHPLDGLLEAYGWHGKRFEGEEEVHPLVFPRPGGGVVSLDPKRFRPALRLIGRLPLPKSALAGRLFRLTMPLFTTGHPRATLRLKDHRGVATATMIYDDLPIQDVFRRVDDDTVLAVMEMKGMATPFFFVLHREPGGRSADAGRPRP